MKKFAVITLLIFFVSCTKKEIKIPTLGIEGIQEIQNHSQAWIFFEVKNGDTIADLNRKNTISTTHWIFNIDKKLPLKKIIPIIQNLQYKHANGMHSKEGMHNYFSYADTISKKLSFVEFDETIFITDSVLSKSYIKKNADSFKNYNNLNITINPNNTWINDAKMEKDELMNTLPEFIEFSAEGKQTMLHLNFNNKLNYQDYLHYNTLLKTLLSPAILINNSEFIFDQSKVPDCGCE